VTTSMELARRSGGRRGPFSTGVCRRRGGRGSRRLSSVASPEREAPAATGRKVGAKQRRAKGSPSHSSPDLAASSTTATSSSRYASPLSAMHVDLGRMVVDVGREANGFAYSPMHGGVKREANGFAYSPMHGGVKRERVQCRLWRVVKKLRACCFH
jgi:hypothetical protein